MKKVKSIQFKWVYSPADYIGQPVEIEEETYKLSITNGVAIADIAPEAFNNESEEFFDTRVRSQFFAALLTTEKDFDLSEPERTDIYEDGSKNCFVKAKGVFAVASAMNVDAEILRDGKVISSTKKERHELQRQLTEIIAANSQTNRTLNHMLKAIKKAETDHNNMLVHLYEIRDALQKKYGSAKTAQNTLGISKADWDELGNLTNRLPLKQGRHRGQHADELRDATVDELNRARHLATEFTKQYIAHIKQEDY